MSLFAFGEALFAPSHLIILLIVGILLFGRRLPEIGRSLGKTLVEFKKSYHGLEDDLSAPQQARNDQPVEAPRPPQRIAATTPKFEEAPATSPRVVAPTPKFDEPPKA
jgi:sec-independent protein translocase protein TatA